MGHESEAKMRHKARTQVKATVSSDFGPRRKLTMRLKDGEFDLEIDSPPPDNPLVTVTQAMGLTLRNVNVKVTGTSSQSGVGLAASCTDDSGNAITIQTVSGPGPTGGDGTWSHTFNAFIAGTATAIGMGDYLYTITGTYVLPGTPGNPGSSTTISVSVWFNVPN
jgi:hypothetical protein